MVTYNKHGRVTTVNKSGQVYHTPKPPPKKPRPQARSSHGMITRHRAAHFRIMDLPPELRNDIYALALAQPEGIPLASYRVPALLQVSSQIRKEASGLFTTVNQLQIATRCNYCVKSSHFAGKNHLFYDKSGTLGSAKAPVSIHRKTWLELRRAVFAGVTIDVLCCCCTDETRIGSLTVTVAAGGVTKIRTEVHNKDSITSDLRKELKEALKVVERNVRVAVKKVRREAKKDGRGLTGFSMQDVEKIAGRLKVPVGDGLDDFA